MSSTRTPAGKYLGAGWSSPVARQAHNLKVTGSNPVPATRPHLIKPSQVILRRIFLFFFRIHPAKDCRDLRVWAGD